MPHSPQVEELLNEKVEDNHNDVIRLGRSNVAIAALVNQLRGTVHQLATKDNSRVTWEAKLSEHCEGLCDRGVQAEAEASLDTPFNFNKDLQAYLSTSIQRVAKFLALKADNYVAKQILVHPEPRDADLGWDRKVDDQRTKLSTGFVSAVYSRCAKRHPTIDPLVLECRTAYFSKLELALKIALSKYQAILPAQTLLGRRPLEACAACDRPFTKLPPSGGDRRALSEDPMAIIDGKLHDQSWSDPASRRPATSSNAAVTPRPLGPGAQRLRACPVGFPRCVILEPLTGGLCWVAELRDRCFPPGRTFNYYRFTTLF